MAAGISLERIVSRIVAHLEAPPPQELTRSQKRNAITIRVRDRVRVRVGVLVP